ncbi:hypothetical protein SO802_020971 [Lithocarpus litseifolius]|uniref:Sulfotransferase n=1 Tax=Lithocarpus litseifolius TaxID=425828 RepID=A0AAW2CIM7_9ROSI
MEFSSSKMNHEPKSNEKVGYRSNNYKEKISTFPKGKGWLSDEVHHYQGFWYSFFYLEGLLLAHEHFKPQPNDIILSSTPKSGTTWLKALSFAIVTRSSFNASTNPLLTTMPHERVLSLESDLAHNSFHGNLDTPLVEILRMHSYLYGTFFARQVIRVSNHRLEKMLSLKRHLSSSVKEYLILDDIRIMC